MSKERMQEFKQKIKKLMLRTKEQEEQSKGATL